MNKILGVLLIIVGIAVGLYVGLWVMFAGGIIQIVTALQAPIAQASEIAVGILKIICAGIVGSVCGTVVVVPGFYMIFKD